MPTPSNGIPHIEHNGEDINCSSMAHDSQNGIAVSRCLSNVIHAVQRGGYMVSRIAFKNLLDISVFVNGAGSLS